MISKTEDTDSGRVRTIDEHTLHEITSNLWRAFVEEGDLADGNLVDMIRIVPSDPELFSPGQVVRYEALINGLLQQAYMLDEGVHRIAEYTC